MEMVMYSREQNGVKVVARQSLEGGKYIYSLEGFVNGEQVRDEKAAGYRDAAPAARKMFKELFGEFVPQTDAPKVGKAKMTIEEKEAAMMQRMQDKIDRQSKKAEEKKAASEEKRAANAAKKAEEAALKQAAIDAGEIPAEEVKAAGKKKYSKKVFSVAAGEVVNDQG